MSVKKKLMDVITTVLILMEAIIVLVWMDMNWNQIITLVQVMITLNMYSHNLDVRTYMAIKFSNVHKLRIKLQIRSYASRLTVVSRMAE